MSAMPPMADKLPPLTILIEWENALDVDDYWTHRAMQAAPPGAR